MNKYMKEYEEGELKTRQNKKINTKIYREMYKKSKGNFFQKCKTHKSLPRRTRDTKK